MTRRRLTGRWRRFKTWLRLVAMYAPTSANIAAIAHRRLIADVEAMHRHIPRAAKSAPHVKAEATKRARWIALRDAKTAELRAGR